MASKDKKVQTIDAELVLDKETKTYVVYAPRGTDAVLSIYVKKSALGNGAPNGFMLTLTERSAK